MSSARLFVRAIVVTDGRSRHLDAVFDAIVKQEFAPDSVHLVTLGDVSIATPSGLDMRVTAAPASATYSEAVAAVLAAVPAHDAEYLWLLHDDSAALPDVLSRLAATARKRSRAAVVGAAQVRWRDTSRLVSLGSTVSRIGARRVDLVDDLDINQGQYDYRDDVLAVSMAGALVSRDVWTTLGGFDDAYRGFGGSADFCRRAWRAGYDVVVVPAALVRHAQLNLHGRRDPETAPRGTHASYAMRRTGEWYHAAVWAPLLAVPLLVLWSFASAVVRALVRVAQNEPRMAWTDLGVPWRLLGRLGSLPRSRHRARRHAKVSARATRALLASQGTVLNYVRARYLRTHDRWRIAVTPTGMIRAELAAAASRRRWMLAVVVVLAGGLATAVFGGWLPDLLAGRMLVGSALGVTDVGWLELWQRTWSGWSNIGYGAPSLDGGFSAALVPFAALPGGLRLWLGLLLSFAPVVAALSAWWAAGAATRAVSVRAVAALAYAAWPPFLVSIAQGRLGAVLAHLALPLVALGVTRALGWHRGEALAHGDEYTARRIASPSAAAAASLALAFCVAVAPVLLVPSLVALAVVAVVARRRWLRVVLIAVPALAVAGPGIQAALRTESLRDAFAILAREAGPTAASTVDSPLRTLLTLDTSPGGSQWYASAGVVAVIALTVIVAAFLALLSGRAPGAVRVGWLVAALGLATTFAVQRTVVAWPDGAGSLAANGWSGAGLSFALLGALAAAAAASRGAWHSGGAIRVRRVAAVVVVSAAAVAVLGSAAAWAWPGRPPAGDVAAADVDVLPLVAALEQLPPNSERVLLLTDTDAGVAYSVENADGAVAVTGTAAFGADGAALARPGLTGVPSPTDLSQAVATLVGAGVGADDDLAAWGIGVIVATPGSPHALAGLSQVDTLSLMGASELGTAYAVSRNGEPTSRAWIETSRSAIPVATHFSAASATLEQDAEVGTLIIAVPADDAWQATLNGTQLASVPDAMGRQAFTVPAGGGHLDVRFDDGRYRMWWWAAAIACGLALIASAPIHERRIIGARS
jgi:GT2 family glycosyltransferase